MHPDDLEERLAELERRVESQVHDERFLRRAFAIWGHWFVGALTLYAVVMLGSLLLGLLLP